MKKMTIINEEKIESEILDNADKEASKGDEE